MESQSCPDDRRPSQELELKKLQELQHCIELGRQLETQEEAQQRFKQWCDRLATENSQAAILVTLLWEEAILANRSALCWQRLNDVEKELCDRMTKDNIQLQQNYLRLLKEQ